MKKIYIVTESGCDLLAADREKYGIETVPMHIQINGNSRDDGSFPPEEIFAVYESTKTLPKTSAANPRDYSRVFDRITATDPSAHIIHMAYSAVTTASFHNAVIAGEDLHSITHIDTKNVTGGRRAVILATAQFIENHPTATMEEIKEYAQNTAEKCRFAFFPGDLEYLKAGGRVSNAAYLVATVLNLKPLIEINDGRLVATRKYRGRNGKVYPRFLDEYLGRNPFEKGSFFMVYSRGLDETVKKQLEKVARSHGYKDFAWVPAGCVISTHAGPAAFGAGGILVKG